MIGDFNRLGSPRRIRCEPVDSTGIWEGIVDGAERRAALQVLPPSTDVRRRTLSRSRRRCPAKSASVVFESKHEWQDDDWLDRRHGQEQLAQPMTIYEVHAPSWRRRALGWRELADQLAPYVRDLGFTHVELLPVMHHPYAGSWGYQVTGFYATVVDDGLSRRLPLLRRPHASPTASACSSTGCRRTSQLDPWALASFDGTALYEHDDPRRGFHPDWGTFVFNLGRTEVQNFLLANALFWLREYHVDGLRVDAVASMLYLDYSRKEGEWIPNAFGGREDLDAVAFLKEFNELIHVREPGGDLGGRGVDGVAGRLASDVCRRARLRLQVEHGVDARHARLLRARADPPHASTTTS